jgi:hypothetical protein
MSCRVQRKTWVTEPRSELSGGATGADPRGYVHTQIVRFVSVHRRWTLAAVWLEVGLNL